MGGLFTFGVKGGYEAGVRIVDTCQLLSHVANIGDTRSLIIHPASTTHRQLDVEQQKAAGAGPDVIRLSVGIETVDDIQFTTRCTVKGTNGRDRLIGTAGGNGICGYDAKDRIFARGGNDAVFGGIGNDRIQGGPGGDTLEGGQGGDVIKAIDGVQGNDTVYGGPGADTCFVDNGDATKGCEDIRLPV